MKLPTHRIAERYQNGETVKKIASSFRCSIFPILRRLHEAGISVRRDRRDNNGHYEVGNIRWATRREQQKNKRMYVIRKDISSSEILRLHRQNLTQLQIAKRLGINDASVSRRLNKLSIPSRSGRNQFSHGDKMKQRESGFVSILSVLIVAAMILVLAAIMVPSSVRLLQVKNEESEAESLAVKNAAFTVAGNVYGIYPAPSSLAGSLATPLSCSNMFLIPGQETQASDGYIETFTGSGTPTAPAASCSGVTGYSSFTIAADPASSLVAQRHFLLSSSDGLLHYSTGRPATIADPVFSVSAVNLGTMLYQPLGTSGGTTPTNPNPPTQTTPAGVYSNVTATYTPGISNGGPACGYNGIFAPFASSVSTVSGSLTLDSLGDVTASTFTNTNAHIAAIDASGNVYSQLSWYIGQPSDINGGVISSSTISLETSTDGGLTFSGGIATFSSNFESFSWSGTQQGSNNCAGATLSITGHQ